MGRVMGIKMLGSMVFLLCFMGMLCRYQPVAKDIDDAGTIATASSTGAVLLALVTTSLALSSSDL
jgi:hypothetical protein